ncbi:hypothetical protein DVH24_021481 [Malus domestica]|uniref:F-box/LRR-repeat protein 15/At3g58940/PEG3-like LRR domain-containing protein n=1 Tax=Malus domestica TaxID=3750 RepID=A0A498JUW6_MALDO|nr:hypothetical protein DVH24_021481 [Malus domestica]
MFVFLSRSDMVSVTKFSVKPPSTFKGFGNLKTLYMQNVSMDQDVLENLIVCCPLLWMLALVDYDGFTHLKIDALNLSYLYFKELIDIGICLTSTLIVHVANDQSRSARSCSNMLKFFVHLPLSFYGHWNLTGYLHYAIFCIFMALVFLCWSFARKAAPTALIPKFFVYTHKLQ